MTARTDRLVDGLARRLAGQSSDRRQFLAKVGFVAAGASAGVLASGTPAAAAAPTGCFGTVGVQPCYSPWKVVAAEFLSDGVTVRRGPSRLAPAIGTVPVGGHVGRQSKRLGSPCGSNPGPRASVDGWLWVSPRAVRPGATSCYSTEYPPVASGWIPMEQGLRTLLKPDPGWAGSTCGPHADFDCRRPQKAYVKPCTCFNGCNHGRAGPMIESRRYYTVSGQMLTKNSISEYYTMRYAADSAPIFWLMPGDVVYRHGYKKLYEPIGPDFGETDDDRRYHTWSCVSVVCAQYAPTGAAGWIRSVSLLNATRTKPTCTPTRLSMPIPS